MLEIRGPRGSGKTRALVALASTDPEAVIIEPTYGQRSLITNFDLHKVMTIDQVKKGRLMGCIARLYLDEVRVSDLPEYTRRYLVVAMTAPLPGGGNDRWYA